MTVIPTRLKLLLLAEEAAGLQLLRAIAASNHQVVAVMTSGAGRPDRASAIRELAEQLGYPCWPAACVKERAFLERIRAADLDVLVNVHSLFRIPGDVLAAPRLGSYNMHPGPLPEYAGLNVVSWALYRGETMHAVTIHHMVPEIDAGPVAYCAAFGIEERDTALTVSVKCVQAGVPLMLRLLETAATDPGTIPATVQDASRRCYYGKGVPQGGRLDWSRPARDVVNFARACDYLPFRSPWGHAVGCVERREVAVVKASRTGEPCAAPPGTVGRVEGRGVRVASADEWVVVHRVVTDGRLVDANRSLRTGQRFEHESGGLA
jgi:methionyl-tRNA formyltransferase